MTVSLEESYARCKVLNRRFGKTYYYATQVLEPDRRKYVHALYGFCRYVDDIVDEFGPAPLDERVARVDAFEQQFFADVARGDSEDAVLRAVVDTVRRFDINLEYFVRFLRSMKMDFSTTTYETFDDLMVYIDGSAAVIGEMTLPILAPTSVDEATPYARDLGVAFQLTNFLRDIGEDRARGRTYVPQADIARFGAEEAWKAGEKTPEFVQLMRFEIARCRELYARSVKGDEYLTGRAKGCIRAARSLYGGILDRIESIDYDVFVRRAKVSGLQKIATVAKLAVLSK